MRRGSTGPSVQSDVPSGSYDALRQQYQLGHRRLVGRVVPRDIVWWGFFVGLFLDFVDHVAILRIYDIPVTIENIAKYGTRLAHVPVTLVVGGICLIVSALVVGWYTAGSVHFQGMGHMDSAGG
jgi:hypothetical protein